MKEKKNRFDLENKINQTSFFSDQLRSLNKSLLDNNIEQDKVAIAIDGLAVLIDIHTEDMFDIFTQALNLDEYKS